MPAVVAPPASVDPSSCLARPQVRLYSEKTLTQAKTSIPGMGLPITEVDVTYDGARGGGRGEGRRRGAAWRRRATAVCWTMQLKKRACFPHNTPRCVSCL